MERVALDMKNIILFSIVLFLCQSLHAFPDHQVKDREPRKGDQYNGTATEDAVGNSPIILRPWSKCDMSCGIGYQTRTRQCVDGSDALCVGGEIFEIQRCLGVDCGSPQELESKIACKSCSKLPLLFAGIFVGVAIVSVACCIKRGGSGPGERPNPRAPAPIPRRPAGEEDCPEEHIYDEIGQKKQTRFDEDEDGYLDPRHLNPENPNKGKDVPPPLPARNKPAGAEPDYVELQ